MLISLNKLVEIVKHSPLKIQSRFINNRFIIKELKLFKHEKYKSFKILFSLKSDWASIISQSFKSTKVECFYENFEDADFKNFDLVIPLNIHDLMICNERRDELVNQIIPIPSAEAIHKCNQKNEFIDLLNKNGLNRFLPSINTALKFPYILKNPIGEYGKSTFIISNKQDELKFAQELLNHVFIKQELISGKYEYATHVLFKNNKIINHVTLKYTHPKSEYVQGNSVYISKTLHNTNRKHLSEMESILRLIEFEGLCCFDYKISNGQIKLFEINPRFGGSLTDYFFSMLRHL